MTRRVHVEGFHTTENSISSGGWYNETYTQITSYGIFVISHNDDLNI